MSVIQNAGVVAVERPLGATEQMLYSMREYGGWNVGSMMHLTGEINHERLRRALEQVVANNAILSYAICPSGLLIESDNRSAGIQKKNRKQSKNHFIKVTSTQLPLEERMVDSEDDVTRVMEQSLAELFDEGSRLWRVHHVQIKSEPLQHYILITYDHCIIDGHSCYQLFDQLLNAYNNVEANFSDESIDKTLSQTLDDTFPMEEKMTYRLSLKDVFYFLKHEFEKQLFPITLSINKQAPLEERETKLLFVSLTPEVTERIALLSRQNGTTVQGALVAALFFAVAKVANNNKGKSRHSCTTPVSMRNLLGIEKDLIGVYASGVGTMHNLNPSSSFWSLAREVKHEVELAMKRNLHLSSMALFEFMQRALSKNVRIGFLNGERCGRLYTSSVTNLGRIELSSNYSDIKVNAAGISVSQQGLGGSYTISPTTFNGTLQFYLHYVTPLTTHDQARALRDCLVSLLSSNLENDFLLSDF